MKTPIEEILEYLERAEKKGIEKLSIKKLKQRIKPKKQKEKKVLIHFFAKGFIEADSGENFYNKYFKNGK